MAAGPWTPYDSFKKYLADGTIDLDGDTFRIGLYTSASNADTDALSTRSSVSNEVASGNGYSLGGKSATAITWAAGASAGVMRFDGTATIFSASGGSIANAKFAVFYDESTGTSAGDRKVCFRSQLSTAQFTITDGNTLTITPSASGYFELT